MRRRIPWIAAVALLVTAVLAGCGSKSADSIVKDLDQVVGKMESYEGSGTMTLYTGQQPLVYKVDVKYQKPQYYRIALTNEKRNITQIVLRNDEGVFVLTPSLNKSYRFQSDWPENQGQVYLYQTLVQSIVLDNSRQFTKDKDAYVFDVMASNYNNGSFARQKIWLSKEDYAPQQVEVTDTDAHVMVSVKFDEFEFGKKFDKSAFDMEENMGKAPGAQSGTNEPAASPSASAEGDPASGAEGEEPSEQPDGEGASAPEPQPSEFVVAEPSPDALPVGVVFKDELDVQLGDTMGVMLRYTGDYDFTIVQAPQRLVDETWNEGIGYDLGFTLGHLAGYDTKTLTWTYEGVEYRLTSANLPETDMVRIAQSMVDSSGK